jgi:hypothetical protein
MVWVVGTVLVVLLVVLAFKRQCGGHGEDVQAAGIKVPPVAASIMSKRAEQTPKIRMAQESTFLVGYRFT